MNVKITIMRESGIYMLIAVLRCVTTVQCNANYQINVTRTCGRAGDHSYMQGARRSYEHGQ